MESTFESLYEKMNPIGGGQFGSVYKCKRKSDCAIFALKEINIQNDIFKYYALKEITAMEKSKDTPYIVKYIQHFKMEDKILIVMEHVEGGNLY
jgi:serine/threonine protein kinase